MAEKKKKKAAAADDGAGEHKRPWRENLATIGEIKAFVSDRYYLRYNVVRRGVKCRRPRRCCSSAIWHTASARRG